MSTYKIGNLLLAIAYLSTLLLPVQAETTMLTGSVNTTALPSTNPVNTYRLLPAQAYYDNRPVITKPVIKRIYVRDQRTFWQRHPMAKGATIGAGVGAGTGALTGLITKRGVLRGAAIGAGTGAGVGVIRTSKIMKRHPIVRDIATGATAGLGLGWAGSRHGRRIGQATGVGAAIGLGVGLFKNLR
jgi:hypothetical protein